MTPARHIGARPMTPVPAAKNPRFMRAVLAALAATVALWAVPWAAPPAARALPCAPGNGCQRWCPGDPLPAGRPVPWDGAVCHDYYWDYYGILDAGTGAFYPWKTMPWR